MSRYDQVKQDIKRHEGCRLKAYRDTRNKLTIGYGWNIEERGIPREIAEQLFDIAFDTAVKDAEQFATSAVWSELTPARRDVLINLAYNLGLVQLLKFKKVRAALSVHDYANAAAELVDSRWYNQVGKRAIELSKQLRLGEYNGVSY